MIRTRNAARLAATLLLLPLAGCVFAVGVEDEEGGDELRDRIRAMERRLDRLEHGGAAPMFHGHAAPGAEAIPAAPEPAK